MASVAHSKKEVSVKDMDQLRRFLQAHRARMGSDGDSFGTVISPVIQHSGLGAFGGLGDFVNQTARLFPNIDWALPLTNRIRRHIGEDLSPPLALVPVELFEPVTGEAFTLDMEIRAHRQSNHSLSWLFFNEDLMDPIERAGRIIASRKPDRAAELRRLDRFYKLLINRNSYHQNPQAPADMTLANTPGLYEVHPLVRRYLTNPGIMNAIIQGAVSKAVVKLMTEAGVEYDLIWAHDWHFCAIVGELLLERNRSLASRVQYVQHLHNALHQGVYQPTELARVLGWPRGHLSDRLYRNYGQMNLLGGALNALRYGRLSGKAIAVSQNHATELPTAERGAGLDRIFKALWRQGKLTGINNPITIPRELVIRNQQDLDTVKPAYKALVQKKFGLAINPDAFLLLWSHRFTQQKQVAATLRAVRSLLEEGHDDLQLVFFCDIFEGSRSEDVRSLHDLIDRYPNNIATDAFDPSDEIAIAAGVDASLMASYFEPFGYAPVWVGMQGGFVITGANGGQVDIFAPKATFFMDIQPDIDKPLKPVIQSWRDVRNHLLVSNAAYRRRVFKENVRSIRNGIVEAKATFADPEKRRTVSLLTMRRIRELTDSGYFCKRIRSEIMSAPIELARYQDMPIRLKAVSTREAGSMPNDENASRFHLIRTYFKTGFGGVR